jgi:hypothetical protein
MVWQTSAGRGRQAARHTATKPISAVSRASGVTHCLRDLNEACPATACPRCTNTPGLPSPCGYEKKSPERTRQR